MPNSAVAGEQVLIPVPSRSSNSSIRLIECLPEVEEKNDYWKSPLSNNKIYKRIHSDKGQER